MPILPAIVFPRSVSGSAGHFRQRPTSAHRTCVPHNWCRRGSWHTALVRMSHFWTLMNDEFGESYAGSLARDHVLGALDNRTVLEALEAGVPPREVWEAVCVDLDVPVEHRLGRDRGVARGAQGGQERGLGGTRGRR